ncbi:LruC domain-containing protein [Alteromonadaceae bacterium Bs31]|nr:LruC domain-containing protein [Alteromonadaceae bacterium Bs31]
MFSKEMKALLFAIGCIFTVQNTKALELDNNQQIWNFMSGSAWPTGYNQSTGKPDSLIYARDEYPSDFFERISNALPEAKVNEAFLAGDSGSNITLQEEAEVFVTFIHEGAGYKNSFGYFTFDANNPPTSVYDIQETIIFPNLSYPHLTNGHRLSLGTFPAGTSIGFFLAANGFWYYTGVKPFAVPYYYSLKDLNPDPTDLLRQHNVLLFDDEVDEVIIGFEDLPRSWGDNDFNDAVFSVKTTPETAIVTDSLIQMPSVNDSDADGIADEEDQFPNNYRRAFSAYYPSESNWVTLAYEDNWPQVGDYDLNDLVVRERFQTVYNANGDITGFIITGYIDARGAEKNNGFGLRLMDLAPEAIEDASITIAGVRQEKNTENWQSDAVFILWNDSHDYTQTGESGACSHFNTKRDCDRFDPVPFTLDVNFAQYPQSLNHSSLDFFIFRTNYRGREVHFANYPPTDLFDQSQFGRFQDTSDPESGRYFKNAANLPWALKVNTNWCHPSEYIDIAWAYPDYEKWVESSGSEASDWYKTSARKNHYFCREDNAFTPDLAPSAVSQSDSITCEITSFNQGPDSYQVDISVTNIGDVDLNTWQLAIQFDTAPNINNSWSANLSVEGNSVSASNLDWNALLIPGNPQSFGFQGASDGSLNQPTCQVQ